MKRMQVLTVVILVAGLLGACGDKYESGDVLIVEEDIIVGSITIEAYEETLESDKVTVDGITHVGVMEGESIKIIEVTDELVLAEPIDSLVGEGVEWWFPKWMLDENTKEK